MLRASEGQRLGGGDAARHAPLQVRGSFNLNRTTGIRGIAA